MKRSIAMTVMCVAMMLMGVHVRADDAQSRCTRIANNWVNFLNSKDSSTASDVFTKDIVEEDVPTGTGMIVGIDAFQKFIDGFFKAFPISTFTLVNSFCSGQHGFIEWSWIAHDGIVNDPVATGFCGTGKPVTGRGVSIIAIHGNRISSTTSYWDFATVLRALLSKGQECAGLVGTGEE
jgi:SnoaL-like domain